MQALTEGIDEALSKKSRDEWGPIFDAAGLIWGPVLGLHEVPIDPQAKAIGLFPTLHDREAGPYRSVAIPMRFGSCVVGPEKGAPQLGEHTTSLVQEFGLKPPFSADER